MEADAPAGHRFRIGESANLNLDIEGPTGHGTGELRQPRRFRGHSARPEPCLRAVADTANGVKDAGMQHGGSVAVGVGQGRVFAVCHPLPINPQGEQDCRDKRPSDASAWLNPCSGSQSKPLRGRRAPPHRSGRMCAPESNPLASLRRPGLRRLASADRSGVGRPHPAGRRLRPDGARSGLADGRRRAQRVLRGGRRAPAWGRIVPRGWDPRPRRPRAAGHPCGPVCGPTGSTYSPARVSRPPRQRYCLRTAR